ncbi:putative ATP-dependent DNA helicase Q1 [Mytilus trossulus]|uniref:putative ATP-dependent DNA helicase Q1 n=1 Tax=Mytilus trossulus TaxID=6551 RepID=UPI003005526E
MDPNARILECLRKYDDNITLKDKQFECLCNILKGNDVICNLPVAYGKSLCYHLLPSLLNGLVLVVSPLNIIQKDQLSSLRTRGVSACKLTFSCNVDGGEENEMDLKDYSLTDVIDGKYSVILCHPEALFNTKSGQGLLRNNTFTSKVQCVVIDECHIVEKWGKEFRSSFASLHTLQAFFVGKPILGLSGTLTADLIKRIPSILGMSNPVFVQESPDRPNIFLNKVEKTTTVDVSKMYEKIFIDECDKLFSDKKSYPVTLMFIPMLYMSHAASYLRHLFGEEDIKTSCYSVVFSRQDAEVIATTLKDLKNENPRIRLVLTTSVSGMGFDPENVSHVIHTVPPRNLSQYLQEIGRAGRRGQNAETTLYHCARDLAKNLPGIQNDIIEYCKNKTECLRTLMLSKFGFEKSETAYLCGKKCCCFCSSSCSCGCSSIN